MVVRIRDSVSDWTVQPLSLAVFGSVGLGRARAESDVDLVVYRGFLDQAQEETWEAQTAALRAGIHTWTGNAAEILELDAPTLVALTASDAAVLRGPRIHISGTALKATQPSGATARALQNWFEGDDDPTGLTAASLMAKEDRLRDAILRAQRLIDAKSQRWS